MTAEGAVVQTSSSERSGIVSSEDIGALAVVNRDFTTFAALQPGVVVTSSVEVQSFTGANTINALGGRTTGNNILIDGIPAGNSNQGNLNTTLSLDATQTVEVKVANFNAEYGRNQGVTVMAVSKGGSQEFHGQAYYYDRNEALNANSFFNNQKSAPRSKYRFANFGGNLGGPLYIPHLSSLKNKLFFFASAEEIREVRVKAEQDLTVPTALERAGDFSQSINSSGKAITIKDPTTGKVFPNNVIPPSQHPGVHAELSEAAAAAELLQHGCQQVSIQLRLPGKHAGPQAHRHGAPGLQCEFQHHHVSAFQLLVRTAGRRRGLGR